MRTFETRNLKRNRCDIRRNDKHELARCPDFMKAVVNKRWNLAQQYHAFLSCVKIIEDAVRIKTFAKYKGGQKDIIQFCTNQSIQNILKFVHSFMMKRTLRVDIGNTYSTSREIENGVLQGTVLSVTLFLVAMAEICRGIEGPTRMFGYADDWVILTSNKTPKTAEARLQSWDGQMKKDSASPLKNKSHADLPKKT
jgi:hypothetical protein